MAKPVDEDEVVQPSVTATVEPVQSATDMDTLAKFMASDRSNSILKFDATDVVYATILFVILQLPIIDDLLEKFLPIAKSLVVRTTIKAFVFFVVLFVLVKVRHNRSRKR